MELSFSRQHFMRLGLAAGLAGLAGAAAPRLARAQTARPLLSRIKTVTIGAPDVDVIAKHYSALLNYSVVEEGAVAIDLALSWGTPNSAGRKFIVMQPETGEDAFVRAVEIDQPDGFKAITIWGWNSKEFVVDDIERVHERIKASPLEILGAPALLGAFPTIGAMQVRGPAEEVLHLTVETGERSASILPLPGDDVGRLIITILAVPDVAAVNDWYAVMFGMTKTPVRNDPIAVVNTAQGMPADHGLDATFLGMAERGNFLELWQLDKGKTTDRPRAFGQLPPGVAMASFSVPDLDVIPAPFLSPPHQDESLIYGSNRSAVFRGPVGELVELVEEP